MTNVLSMFSTRGRGELQRRRRALGFTVTHLAYLAGVSPADVLNVECGKPNPNQAAVIHALDVAEKTVLDRASEIMGYAQ